jgi:hypothetical protein
MLVQHLLQAITKRLHSSSSIHTIYGDPIEAQGKTLIPVAKVSYGFGGGAVGTNSLDCADKAAVREYRRRRWRRRRHSHGSARHGGSNPAADPVSPVWRWQANAWSLGSRPCRRTLDGKKVLSKGTQLSTACLHDVNVNFKLGHYRLSPHESRIPPR